VLGSATVGADGCAEIETTLPSDAVLGDATLTFAGTNSLGEQVTLVKDVTVYAPVPNRAPELPATVPAQLAATGQSDRELTLLGMILFGTGLGLTGVARRRNRRFTQRR
jgi:LPXTG-motif cell wall-anchored protein